LGSHGHGGDSQKAAIPAAFSFLDEIRADISAEDLKDENNLV